jgi:hypothetical protein
MAFSLAESHNHNVTHLGNQGSLALAAVSRIRRVQGYAVGVMRLLGPKSYLDLLNIFNEENSVKDRWDPPKDPWPRKRFEEANGQFNGEWNEFELSHTDLLGVKLIWHTNDAFEIPQEGMVVSEALRLPLVQSWIAKGEHNSYPGETHIWLAREPLKNSGTPEYGHLKNCERHLITLDGIHRLLVWADFGKQTTLAFVAGKIV